MNYYQKKNPIKFYCTPFLILISGAIISCAQVPKSENQPPSRPPENQSINVDVAIATLDTPTTITEYIGTTTPWKEVSLRSQVEGNLLNLTVDVGDRLVKGQQIAAIDDSIQVGRVNKAEADLLALESELVQAKSRVNSAKIEREKTKVELNQAENDAVRFTKLYQDGAISQKEAENYQFSAQIAQKNLQTATEQINIEEKVIHTLNARIVAQKAVIAQEQQQLAYYRLFSPINGIVTAKLTEIGNLITPSTEIIKIGDFSQVKIIVPVSELELKNINLGQLVDVKFDAFPDDFFQGKLTTISPVIDTNNRKVNLEITLNNVNNKITAGLLTRVIFNKDTQQKIIIPESALHQNQDSYYIFILENKQGKQTTVKKQPVEIANILNGKAEVISGLIPDQQFVINSTSPLTDGDRVNLSVLSPK